MTKLKYGCVSSRDVTRAVRFYTEALGMAVKFQDGERWAQFDLGGVGFAIASPQELPVEKSGSVLVFEVDDVAPTMDAVVAGGGAIVEQRDMGSHGRVVTVRDPEGNVLQLFARAAPDFNAP
jgi:predicted enzyme related to lactoylglutathione lyase